MPADTPFDPLRPDLKLAIAGAGVMGRGIAQIAAQAGISVLLYDSREGAAAEAREHVASTLSKLSQKGKLSAEAVERAVSNLQVVRALSDFSACSVVVEAIVENLEAKRELFRALEGVVAKDCILASNTSSLQVTSIAAACAHPERVAGYHFFNPVPLMKVVEVVDSLMTASWVSDALMAIAKRCGHTPVRAKDTPGFIVNHAGRGYGTEALRILSEGIAEFYEIDRILRESAGFRMGPFELLDLTGLDVSHPAMEAIYHQYYQEPRYRPSQIAAQRTVAGLLGRKSGRGFYRYDTGAQEAMPAAPAPAVRPARAWVSTRGLGPKLKDLVARLGATIDGNATPASGSLCLVAPLGHDATSTALEEGLDPIRTVAVDCFFPLEKRRTLMTTPLTSGAMRDAAHGLLAADGVPVSVIHDSPGFVNQRVIAQIVNIASDIAQQRIASPADIDAAVSLGLGYPKGPLAWGDTVGASRILAILQALSAFYGDPRYRASPWLKRRALLGVSLLTPEA
ncbi:MAG: 3-hydroxyacyl-CoA dehydrogenase [Betaproteobacteria bacterium]|nr:3-hydroxyacyl-CoA dehydrogenase [Betaproteobacteria bacterium]MBI2959300.1 3-hydroxyacyl-CoA dehydrogenase [Betaproteobacteria bacterium]